MYRAFIVSILLGSVVSQAGGAGIAAWDFDDGDLLVDTGSGTLGSTASSPGFVVDAPGDKSLQILSSGNNGRSLTISVDLSAFYDPVMTFSARRNATGFRPNAVSFSADGGLTFTPAGTFNPASFFSGWTFNLDDADALDGNPASQIRITLAGATSTTGSVGFDEFAIVAIPVPEPTGVLLWLAGALIALSHRSLRTR